MAGVTVLNGEVGLAELGGAVAVLWKVTLVVARPTLGSSRKELKREKGETASANRNLTAETNTAPDPQLCPKTRALI